MNKKLIGNLILLSLAITLALTQIDLGAREYTYEEEIRYFILDKLEEDAEYIPVSFEEINEAFLLKQDKILTPLVDIQDSIRKQLELIRMAPLSEEMKGLLAKAETEETNMTLEGVDDYLKLDASLKRQLKKELTLDALTAANLYVEESRMHEAINQLNQQLSLYNLSVFGLALNEGENVSYLHQFQLNYGAFGMKDHKAIVELNKETKEVIAFREI